MKKVSSRRFVIDASVARASTSTDAKTGAGSQCRHALLGILEICHHVVVTAAIRDEWRRHSSNFARRWLKQMYSRRKVDTVDAPEDVELRRQIGRARASTSMRAAMLKDCHLLEAAMRTDGLIMSLDDEARGLFADFAEHHDRSGRIVWVNPARPADETQAWLQAGAPSEAERTLDSTRVRRAESKRAGTS